MFRGLCHLQKILDLKGKVIVDTGLHKISYQIDKLAEAIDQISLGNRKLAITKNANSMLEERVKILETKDDRKAV